MRKLVGDKCPFIVCLQETKLMQLDDFVCSSLWGSSPHVYSFRPSVGALGGLLIMWIRRKWRFLQLFPLIMLWK